MTGIIAAAGITAAAGLAGGLLSSGKGSGGTQTQMQQQEQKLPGWIEGPAQDLLTQGWQAAANLGNPYSGQRVANLTPEQRAMIAQLYGNVGSTNAGFDQALGMVNGLSGFNSGQVTPGMLRTTSLDPYLRPFTNLVTDPTMQLMEQSRRQSLGQIGDQASQARAFGGSRQGIAEGVTNSQSELQKGKYAGELYGQNFAQAQAAARGDISQDYSAQVANMGARQYDATFQSRLADQLGGLTSAKQNNWLTGLTAAMGGQDVIRQNEQDRLKADQAYYNELRNYPLEQLQIRQNALANTPYGKSSMTQTTGPGPSNDPWMTGLGTAATVGGLIGSFGKAGLFNGLSGSGYTTNNDMLRTNAEIANWSNYGVPGAYRG